MSSLPMFLAVPLLIAVADPLVAPGADAGFVLRAPLLNSDRYVELSQHMHADDPLARLAATLNRSLHLSRPIGLRYAECGEANAFYDPEAAEVRLCFELIEQLAEDFGARLEDDAELADAVSGAYAFIALHEIGHALVDALQLPITGREEDAADQLSAWLLIGEAGGSDAVLSAAAAFSIAGESHDVGENDFADEHSLDQQRYFSMVCWVYGSDPQAHSALVEASGLPPLRAERCAEEFARLDRSWRTLLSDYVRAPP